MKTKTESKQRKQEREFNIESELLGEFGSVYDTDFLDEEAFILCNAEDDE